MSAGKNHQPRIGNELRELDGMLGFHDVAVADEDQGRRTNRAQVCVRHILK